MKRPPMLLAAAAAGVLLVILAWIGLSPGKHGREWQGWVEADFLFVGPDEAGRLTSLAVAEGREVQPGDALFTVESDIQEAEWRQANAALEEAKARLAKAEAAAQRPEEIAVLQAQEARAKAALEQSKPELQRTQELVTRGVSPAARLEQAKAAYNRDVAQLAEIERQIHVARLKSRIEDIDAAREVVAQAKARVASTETRRRQRSVAAPATGHVQEIFFRPGEVVPAGRPVVSLLPPGNLKVRFFVPQSELPHLALGDGLIITCDGCAAGITAQITFISAQAEFTPPVIFSPEERAKLVFRVEARPARPELLRVGQPVSVMSAPAARREAANARR